MSTKRPQRIVAVDIVAFNGLSAKGSSHVLLIKRGHEPFKGCWALPGGHVEGTEDLKDAAMRECNEEVGIYLRPYDLEQLGAYGKPGSDPRGDYLSVAFVALMGRKVKPCAGDGAVEAKWHDLGELPPLAFHHSQVIEDALHDGRF